MARSVLILAMGGTIAMASPDRDGSSAVVPRLDSDALVDAVAPWLPRGLTVKGETRGVLPSANMTVAAAADLACRILRAAGEGVDGIVVTHGTDTLEETAYLLSLFLGTPPVPVVVTGAMRPASAAGADGPANLLAAVHLAAERSARRYGVLVLCADRVFAARDVTKAHTHLLDAFAAHQAAAVGLMQEGRPVWHGPPPPVARPAFAPEDFAGGRPLKHVPVVEALFDADPDRSLAPIEKADGAVLRAFGAGHVPQSWVAPLADLARAKPLVLASRVPFGAVARASYGYPGSERDLLARGFLHAGRLNAQKARLLLMLLLSAGVGGPALTKRFAALVGG